MYRLVLRQQWCPLPRPRARLPGRHLPAQGPDGYSARLAEKDLRLKLARADFRNDLRPLVSAWPDEYEVEIAGEMVIADLFAILG
ncbi:MAG: hypothetical protein ACYCR4_04145 [Acidimicrobiales bacterium]